MFRRVFIILALMLGVAAQPAMAGSQLENAVSLWLQGDDTRSLRMLATLAADGNVDARLLLARIETLDLGPSPFRQSLTAEQSRELFRQSDISAFGRSWLAVEAKEGNARAQALLRSNYPEPDLELIAQLNEMGEHEATDHPTRIAALYGDQHMRDALLGDDRVQSDLKPYVSYLSGTPEPRGDGLAVLRHIQPEQVSAAQPEALGMAGMLGLGLGYGDVSPDNPWRPAVENWLMSAASTEPVADLCRTQCADEARACAFAFLALSGGYFEVIRFDSPLEAVIPQDRFLDSPRARLMVLRRAVLARTETNLAWLADSSELAGISSCAADLINEERSKYR